VLPADTFHDLGHGLAMGMRDYRTLIVQASRKLLDSGKFLNTKKAEASFGRLFELSYALNPDGTVEPIGSGPMVLETIREERGRLVPIFRDPNSIKNQKRGYRPFASRREWVEETRRMIALIP
jgi:hypothetical protein